MLTEVRRILSLAAPEAEVPNLARGGEERRDCSTGPPLCLTPNYWGPTQGTLRRVSLSLSLARAFSVPAHAVFLSPRGLLTAWRRGSRRSRLTGEEAREGAPRGAPSLSLLEGWEMRDPYPEAPSLLDTREGAEVEVPRFSSRSPGIVGKRVYGGGQRLDSRFRRSPRYAPHVVAAPQRWAW